MVHHHSNKRTNDNVWVHLDERSLFLSFPYVPSEKLVHAEHKLLEKHLRQLVFLKCRVQQETLEVGIVLVMLERSKCEPFKYGPIILASDCVGCHSGRLKLPASRKSFVIKDSGVEFFLGGEVSKHHCFGNACCLSNLLGCRAPKTSLGEQADCHLNNLVLAIFASHSSTAICSPVFTVLGCNVLAQF